MDESPSPERGVLISDDGSYRYLTVEEAERRLASMPSRECPRCDGKRQMERRGEMERCTQCQGVGRIPWKSEPV